MSEAAMTTDHRTIRNWVEARNGKPARVRGTGDGGLRIDFDPPNDDLEPMNWDDFFAVFDDRQMGFLHQDITEEGVVSRFNKLVDRHNPEGE